MSTKKPYWIITADNHLGATPWENPIREEDYYKGFQNLCSLAANQPLCLGIIALGDIRERAAIHAKNLGGLNRGLKILLEAQKPLLAIMGNHDQTNPNWIEEMCYPCLHNLADKTVQEKHGFDPEKTLALNFTPKGNLQQKILESCKPENIQTAFLHQSLKEFTASTKQSHDTNLQELAKTGFGKKHHCLIFLGDIHNYGDTTLHNITAAYPGSHEMTDINEGINGLKSNKIQTQPHDHRKFAIRFHPEDNSWEPFELKPRPWFRGKAKTQKETERILQLLSETAKTWKKPGCVKISLPKKELERARLLVKNIPILEARIEEYDPESEEDTQDQTPQKETSLSWTENKQALLQLAKESNLDTQALQLLIEIAARDGSTPNPKNDVASAWEAWNKNTP